MTRYILIDNCTGFIWGDSADLNGAIFTGSPVEYAAALDASLGERGRSYTMQSHDPRTNESGYHVYRADVDGSEAVPVVWDGQDQDTIDAVQRDCAYLGFIEFDGDTDIEVGDRVAGGKPGTEDHDTGIVHEIDGDRAYVGWDSGVSTWSPVSLLRLEQ